MKTLEVCEIKKDNLTPSEQMINMAQVASTSSVNFLCLVLNPLILVISEFICC